jgi:hypothetical protein
MIVLTNSTEQTEEEQQNNAVDDVTVDATF